MNNSNLLSNQINHVDTVEPSEGIEEFWAMNERETSWELSITTHDFDIFCFASVAVADSFVL